MVLQPVESKVRTSMTDSGVDRMLPRIVSSSLVRAAQVNQNSTFSGLGNLLTLTVDPKEDPADAQGEGPVDLVADPAGATVVDL